MAGLHVYLGLSSYPGARRTSTSWDQADRMARRSHDLEVSAISGDKCGTDRHSFSSRYPTVDLTMLAASTTSITSPMNMMPQFPNSLQVCLNTWSHCSVAPLAIRGHRGHKRQRQQLCTRG